MNIVRLFLGAAVAVGLSACATNSSDAIQVKIATKLKTEGERIDPPSVVMRTKDVAMVEISDGEPKTSDFKAEFKTTEVAGEHFVSGYVQRGMLKRLTGPGRFAKGEFKLVPVDGKAHKVPMGTLGYAEITPTLIDATGAPVVR